jgi:CubicO group peptidase (beta-lactamase class C family)
LVSPPGTKFNYSSYGFNLLSAAIEKACAEDFLSCIRDLVFNPLGLRSTLADQPSELIEQRARFYTHWKNKPLENAPYTDNSYKWAGGGFLSSPSVLYSDRVWPKILVACARKQREGASSDKRQRAAGRIDRKHLDLVVDIVQHI